MSNNLGSLIECASHVNTRLRYVRRLMQTSGSQRKLKVIQEAYVSQKNYVLSVPINLNALNGVLLTNDTEFGVDYLPQTEMQFVVKER